MVVKDLLVDLSGMGCRTLGKWANLMIYPELRVRARLLDDPTLEYPFSILIEPRGNWIGADIAFEQVGSRVTYPAHGDSIY